MGHWWWTLDEGEDFVYSYVLLNTVSSHKRYKEIHWKKGGSTSTYECLINVIKHTQVAWNLWFTNTEGCNKKLQMIQPTYILSHSNCCFFLGDPCSHQLGRFTQTAIIESITTPALLKTHLSSRHPSRGRNQSVGWPGSRLKRWGK